MARLDIEAVDATTVRVGGRDRLFFGGCNYLGLHAHPLVVEAARKGLLRYGISAGASRETTGNTVEHEALESELAAALGAGGVVLTSDGYLANMACAQALHPDLPRAIFDPESHASITDALRASGASAAVCAREELCRTLDSATALWTDGVFPSEGHVVPAAQLHASARRAGATLVIDDCHGFGVVGSRGLGTCEGLDFEAGDLVSTLTFSKALGCGGGAVVSSAPFADRVRRSAAYVGATPIPAAIVSAARVALWLLTEDPRILGALRTNIGLLREAFTGAGLPIPESPLPVLAISPDDEAAAERLTAAFEREGLLVPRIRYPGGPSGHYFRTVVTAAHTAADIERLARALLGASPAG